MRNDHRKKLLFAEGENVRHAGLALIEAAEACEKRIHAVAPRVRRMSTDCAANDSPLERFAAAIEAVAEAEAIGAANAGPCRCCSPESKAETLWECASRLHQWDLAIAKLGGA